MENRTLTRDEIYQTLLVALKEKRPAPPAGWCASQLDEELRRAIGEYEPDAPLKQQDALQTSLFYLEAISKICSEQNQQTAELDKA